MELLTSNLMLSTSQSSNVRETISSTQSQITQIDNQLTRLMACVTELKHKRNILGKYTDMLTVLIAPIRCLPPEILSEIFLHCIQPHSFDSPYYSPNARLDRAPWLITHVCSRWRSIALSTPRLWASFALTIRPKYLRSDVLLAKTWLWRSGKCLLSIHLESEGKYHNTMFSLMEVFLLHCERWYDVRLSLPVPVMNSLSAAKHRLPMLRKLSIVGACATACNMFEYAPQLRFFRLNSIVPLSMIKVPWRQLQHCDTGTRTTSCCLDLLRLTPNLESCIVSLHSPLYSPQPAVQLAHLRSLTIHGAAAHLLDQLLVPNLCEVFVNVSFGVQIATPQLISFLLRCPIQKLSFYSHSNYPHHDHEVLQLLQASPTLVELHLRGHSSQCMTRSFLIKFADRQSSENSEAPRLVPLLHTITVDYSPSHFDFSIFIAAIQSRVIHGALKEIKICYTPHKRTKVAHDTVTASRLRCLLNKGLRIHVFQISEGRVGGPF